MLWENLLPPQPKMPGSKSDLSSRVAKINKTGSRVSGVTLDGEIINSV